MSHASRRPNPRGQGGRLREELLDAASRLLEAGGRDAEITLRGVAREAGVAAPSVYQHFGDLDELMLALVAHHLDRLRSALVTAAVPVAAGGADVAGQVRAMAHAYVSWGLANPGPYTVVFEARVLRHLTRDQELAMTAGNDLLGTLADLLAAALGPEPPRDPALLATVAWTSLHGLVALRTAKPAYPWPPLDDHVDAVVDGVVAALGAWLPGGAARA